MVGLTRTKLYTKDFKKPEKHSYCMVIEDQKQKIENETVADHLGKDDNKVDKYERETDKYLDKIATHCTKEPSHLVNSKIEKKLKLLRGVRDKLSKVFDKSNFKFK